MIDKLSCFGGVAKLERRVGHPGRKNRRRLVVENLEARNLLATFLVANTNDSGAGSLRQAILDANGNAGSDTIEFNIPATDPGFVDVDSALVGGDAAADAFVIQPLSALPALSNATGGTTIDGRSQAAFSGDTNPFGPEIVIDGSLAGADGLFINSDNNRVFGLNIQGFQGAGLDGIEINGNDNWIAGNYIGTDATGSSAVANGSDGVQIRGGGFNLIGTNGDGVDDEAERNVISGNDEIGIFLLGDAHDNVIAGNFIGTDATGTVALGNVGQAAIVIGFGSASKSNRVGTNGDGMADAAERNVISGNLKQGVHIFGGSQNVVAGNYIGTDVTGTVALANGGDGVRIVGGASSNIIGSDGDGVADAAERNIISGNGSRGIGILQAGTNQNVVAGNYIGADVSGTMALGNGQEGVLILGGGQFNTIGTNGDGMGDAAEANVIAFNTLVGVTIIHNTTTGNSIRGNSTHSNGGLGIDLNNDGVTLNDPGDGDSGPNNMQNFPVLSFALAGASTQVVGSLNSTPNTTFMLDFYANTVPDPSGHGEGERFLGSVEVTTDGSGNADFDVTLSSASGPGEFIAGTATAPDGSTSEFSGPEQTVFLPMAIDIKPGSFPNSINLGSRGTVPVAIFSTDTFDATTVDPATVVLAGADVKLKGNGTAQASKEDVDGDGLLDLVVHVETEALELTEGGVEAVLTGETFDGTPIRGVDSVRIVPDDDSALRLAAAPAHGFAADIVTRAFVAPVFQQAISLWAASGIDSHRLGAAGQIDVRIMDLPGSVLGAASPAGIIWLDRDAAGYGWNTSGLVGGVDLLWTVAHEFGHVLGFAHDHHNPVMAATLAPRMYGSAIKLGVDTRAVDDLFSLLGNTRSSLALVSPANSLSRNDELNGVRSQYHLLEPVLVEAEQTYLLDRKSFDGMNDADTFSHFWESPSRRLKGLEADERLSTASQIGGGVWE